MVLGRTKRIKCRDHGGIFEVLTSRGRQPVRCKAEFPCDKHDETPDPPGRMPAEAPKQANPSLTLAKAAKARLEALGWVVKGRAGVQESGMTWATLTCSRDTETLILNWKDGQITAQDYSLEPLTDGHLAMEQHPGRKLHFDPAELTDSELVKTIRGMPVRWWNTIAGSEERAVIGNKVTIEHIFRENGDEDESKRIVKFIDHNGGGFRAFHVSALLKVG